VFAGGGFEKSFGGVRGVGVLEALALADGVVGEDGKTVAGEGAGEGIISDFAGETVAGGDDDGREFLLWGVGLGVGKVEKCCDREVRLGLVEDLFNAKAVGLRSSERFGVEGSFFGESADKCEEFLANLALAGLGLSSSGDGSDGGAAGSGFFGGNVIEILGQLSATDVGGAVGIWAGSCLREEAHGSQKHRYGDKRNVSHRSVLI